MGLLIRRPLVLVVLVLTVSGCREEGSPGPSGDCVDVDGDWIVEAHCETALVGIDVGIVQSGCGLRTTGAFDRFSGAVDDMGTITLSGVAYEGGPELDCAGTATSSRITFECPADCPIALVRPGGE